MKTLLSNLVLLLFILVFHSCKKTLEKSEPNPPLNSEMAAKVDRWLETQKLQAQPNRLANLTLLKNNLAFNKLSVEQSNAKEQIVVIPIGESFKTNSNIEKNSIINFVLILDSSSLIKQHSYLCTKRK